MCTTEPAPAPANVAQPVLVNTPAHTLLVEAAQKRARMLQRMLAEGSRDYEVMQEFLDDLRSYQQAADALTGQG